MKDSDLIKRGDVKALVLKYADNEDVKDGWNGAIDAVLSIPAVDAVEVVRCKECIHRKKYQADEQQGDTICTLEWNIRKLDWFCADGQRREDGDA